MYQHEAEVHRVAWRRLFLGRMWTGLLQLEGTPLAPVSQLDMGENAASEVWLRRREQFLSEVAIGAVVLPVVFGGAQQSRVECSNVDSLCFIVSICLEINGRAIQSERDVMPRCTSNEQG